MEALEVPEVIRCVVLCMLEAVKGELCLPEVMHCVLGTLLVRSVSGYRNFRCGSFLVIYTPPAQRAEKGRGPWRPISQNAFLHHTRLPLILQLYDPILLVFNDIAL